jgi:hypothetical protein
MNNNLSPVPLDNDLESSFQEKIVETSELDESVQVPSEPSMVTTEPSNEPVNENPTPVIKTQSKPTKNIQINNYHPPEILFWTEDPNVLLNTHYWHEFFPTESMTFNQKLNALTRIVLVLTIISYLFTQKPRILVVSGISLLCIFLLHYATNQKLLGEGFIQNKDGYVRNYNRKGPFVAIDTNENQYQPSTPVNPLSNVLMSDYDYNPHKKPAPPAFTKKDRETILDETKTQIQMLNPDQPNIDKKLFQDVTENLELEQSMRQFYSTANTTIPNDQKGFAEFCYGDMISAKEGNNFAAVRNNPRYNLH